MPRSTTLDEIRARFRHKATAPDTLFLLGSKDALTFLDEATSLGLTLAGVEGFSITDAGAYEPRQDFSNDHEGWHGSREEFADKTRELLRRGAGLGIRFQIVFEGS